MIKMTSYRIQFLDSDPIYYANSDKPIFPLADGVIFYSYIVGWKNEKTGKNDIYEAILRQPFKRTNSFVLPSPETNYYGIWVWDGNREEPTLSPSFLADFGNGDKLHLFVKKGQLEILSDSTVDYRDLKKVK